MRIGINAVEFLEDTLGFYVYEELKRDIVNAFHYMEERGWNYGRAGNISVFVRENGHVLVTPSGVLKAKLKPEDILVLDVKGNLLEGRGKPTIELPLHLAIYDAYEYFNAVVHAHGVYSTTLSITRDPLPLLIEEMVMYLGGEVRVAEYAPSGTEELAEKVVKALNGRKAVILANHGVVACGKDLEEAVEVLGLVERLSQIYILARLLGKVHLLSTSETKLTP
ncbi:MAG: class II aldolase/adducin family protein [Desulfurococcaceae archaeon]